MPWPFTDFETSGFWGKGGKLITEVSLFVRWVGVGGG